MNQEQDTAQEAHEVIAAPETDAAAPSGDFHRDLIARAEAELENGTPGPDGAETGGPVKNKAAMPPKTEPQDGPKDADGAKDAPAEPKPAAQGDKTLDNLTASWPEADKKLLASAPEEIKALVGKYYHNMLTDYKQKTQQAAALKASVEAELHALKPLVAGKFKDMSEFASYVSDAQAFERELQADPRRTLALLAQKLGVDLGELGDYRPDPVREAVRPLQSELEQMKRLLTKTQTAATDTDAAQDWPEPQRQELRLAVEQFQNAVGEDGQLKHPHFAELAPVMGHLMKQGGHQDLEKAYNDALFVLPAEREKLLQTRQQAEQARQAELDKAKKAASLKLRYAGGAGHVSNKKKNIMDIIAQSEQELDGE